MPFVKNPQLMLGHMQAEGDETRATAERYSGMLADRLLAGWRAAEHVSPTHAGAMVSKFANGCATDLLNCRTEAGKLMLEEIGRDVGHIRKDLSISFGFGGPAAYTNEQAAANAAQFVREIGNDTRTTLNAVISQGVQAGLPPEATGRTLRESIGLTIAQAAAVQNYRRLLERGNIEALRRALRDKRFDVDPSQLVNLTADQIDARVNAYRQRYLSYRANTIARYETLAAANGGALSSISNAMTAGIIPPTTRVMWMIAKDELVCPRCRSIVNLQPNGVQLGQQFQWSHEGRTGHISFAPLHPDCRCTNTYRVMR